ncbi:MAG: hypothetical protein AB1390_10030 [Nitrospirota bacterium]
MERQDIHVREIRELAKKFTPQEIEGCIEHQLKEGTNICEVTGTTEHVINELAKAEFVRDMMDKGTTLIEALRELARRIRRVQTLFGEADKK